LENQAVLIQPVENLATGIRVREQRLDLLIGDVLKYEFAGSPETCQSESRSGGSRITVKDLAGREPCRGCGKCGTDPVLLFPCDIENQDAVGIRLRVDETGACDDAATVRRPARILDQSVLEEAQLLDPRAIHVGRKQNRITRFFLA